MEQDNRLNIYRNEGEGIFMKTIIKSGFRKLGKGAFS